MTETEAGLPYIIMPEQADYVFVEHGKAARSPRRSANQLAGIFRVGGRAPVGSYVLQDGEWYRVGTDRPAMQPWTAYIRQADGMTLLDTWAGLTMSIHGVADELDPTPVKSATTDGKPQSATIYTLGGTKATPRHRGVGIEVKGGKVSRKIVK